jgi:hypothetical protein
MAPGSAIAMPEYDRCGPLEHPARSHCCQAKHSLDTAAPPGVQCADAGGKTDSTFALQHLTTASAQAPSRLRGRCAVCVFSLSDGVLWE